jgi:Zn-finger nucleic acid-binding protein
VTLHGCGVCGGVFLARACADRLAATLSAEAIALAERASRQARHAPDRSVPLDCPMCRKVMKRTRAAMAQVDLDSCATCGTWYDRDEIRHVTDAIRSSGWGGAAVAGATAAGAGVAVGAATVATDRAATGAVTRDQVVQVTAESTAEVGIEVVATSIDAADVLGGVFDVLAGLLD